MTGPCGECVHFSYAGCPDRMVLAGFGRCSELRTWQFQSARAACAFEPSRFKAKRPADDVKRGYPGDQMPEEIDFG